MIKCPKCGGVSHHPKDEEQRFCAACNQFHDTMTENKTDENELLEIRSKTLQLLFKWRDDAKEAAAMYKISAVIFTHIEKQPEFAQLCHDMKAQAESNAGRMEKLIIGFNAPKP